MTAAVPDPREPKPCPRCGETCTHDGWGHVHPNGVGIGSCTVPDPRFRDQLAEAIFAKWGYPQPWGDLDEGRRKVWLQTAEALIDDVIAAEVEARVQAAGDQRAAEAATDALMWAAWTVEHSPGIKHQARAVTAIRARAAALASPAPALDAEAGQ